MLCFLIGALCIKYGRGLTIELVMEDSSRTKECEEVILEAVTFVSFPLGGKQKRRGLVLMGLPIFVFVRDVGVWKNP